MKNVLFIVGDCYPIGSANGICCMELVKSFKQKGCSVSILCNKKYNEEDYYEIDGIKIYKCTFNFIKKNIEKCNNIKKKFVKNVCYKFFKTFEKLLIFLNICWYPFYSLFSIIHLKKIGKKICIDNKIDTVISIIHPIESFLIAKKISKISRNINFISIFLDSLSYGLAKNNFFDRIKNNRLSMWENKIFNFSNYIIIMNAYKEYYSKKYRNYSYKIGYSDIPLFSKLHLSQKVIKKNNVTFIYSGTLYRDIRNPLSICEIFSKISKDKNYIFNFFSRGDCDDILDKYSKLSRGKIVKKGYVSHEELLQNIFSSDVIVSIGSKDCDMVPSKIFEYMSTGKKILHIISSENDPAIEYLEKYPNVLFIRNNDDIEFVSKRLDDFINAKSIKIDMNYLEKQFQKNMPDYTYYLIKKNIK